MQTQSAQASQLLHKAAWTWKQEKDCQELLQEKKHLHTEATEYSKQIVEYATNMADLEKEKNRAMEAIADQNHFVQKMVATERKQKQELETAASQIGSLKHMRMNNLTINKTRDSEMATLRQQLQALEEKMAQLGIEKDKEEDRKDLEEAIAMSETAEATAESSEAALAATAAPAAARGGDEMDVDEDGQRSSSNLSWNCLI